MRAEPLRSVPVMPDFRLQRGQCLGPRFAVGQRLARLLPMIGARTLLLLQRLHGNVEIGKVAID